MGEGRQAESSLASEKVAEGLSTVRPAYPQKTQSYPQNRVLEDRSGSRHSPDMGVIGKDRDQVWRMQMWRSCGDRWGSGLTILSMMV
jgi:hypothetical protein